MSMKKILLCCLLSSFFAANSYAQVVDLFDDDSLSTPNKNEIKTAKPVQDIADSRETSESKEVENSDNAGLFSFITKPISLLFSADDKVEKPDGSEETFLEKSTRQAREGNLEDQMNLAYMYLYGTNGVNQDFTKAFEFYQMAAAQNDAIALNNLGSLYFNGIGTATDVKKAIEMFAKSAELGNDNAATNLAFIYLKGGVKDPKRNKIAMDLFLKAADSGNNVAKFMVGYAYYIGFVFEQNYGKAYQLVRSAAGKDSNLDEAELILAEMYLKGIGTTQNFGKGINAYKAAVQQGNTEAYMKLADIYAKGKITPTNLIMAHALYNIAAVQEEPDAAKYRDAIGTKLKLEELQQAQAEAQNFKPKPSELTLFIRRTFGFDIRSYIDMNVLSPKGNK